MFLDWVERALQLWTKATLIITVGNGLISAESILAKYFN